MPVAEAPQRIEDFALAGDAGNQDVVLAHAGHHALEHGVGPHPHPMRHEDVLGRAVGRIAGELPERTLSLRFVRGGTRPALWCYRPRTFPR